MDFLCKKEKIRWFDTVIAILLGTIIIGGILCICGTIWSGYHFVDDHELLRIGLAAQQKQPFLTILKAWMDSDITWRYRPLYWLERITCGYLFGSDLTVWNIWTTLKGIVAFALLYETARFLDYNRLISAIFPMIIILGTQFTPWYRSANQESTGLLLCAGALCLIAAQHYYGKYRSPRFNVPIVIIVVASGLAKESFTLFMPIFPALMLWLAYWDERNSFQGKASGKTSIRKIFQLIRQNIVSYLLIAAAFLGNVYMILFYVGVDHVSYAGFTSNTSILQYLNGIRTSLLEYTKWDTLIACVLLFMILLCYQLIDKNYIGKYLSLSAILLCAMIIQLIAHARSGMWQRYLFPYIIAYALLFVLLGYRIFEADKFRSKIYLLLLFALLSVKIPTAAYSARDYAKDGAWTAEFFQCILEHTEAEDRIASAFNDEELNLSTECWLETHERAQVYSCTNGEWKNIVQLIDPLNGDCSSDNIKIITCYSYAQTYVLSQIEGASEDDYDTYTYGNYMVMVRK